MKIPVSVVKCDNYSEPNVSGALSKCLKQIGGIERFVKSGDRVALKVNLLCAATPSRAVTTHPSVVAAIAKIVEGAGGKATIVDSPGAVARYTASNLRNLYQVTGMTEAADEGGAKLNYDTSSVSVSVPNAKLVKRFDIIKPILEADVVINLPKFKTHEFTYLTAGVKNLFGVLPGKTKAGYHATLKNIRNFSEMLIDLFLYVDPDLTVVDAIVGMDGDGPTSGRPRDLGFLVASKNALAVDVLLAEAVGIDPRSIPHIRAAADRSSVVEALRILKSWVKLSIQSASRISLCQRL